MDTQRESDGNKYVILVLTDESKDILKRMKNYGKKKIRDPIRSITNNSVIYDDKYMKINFNLNDNLLLKTLEL